MFWATRNALVPVLSSHIGNIPKETSFLSAGIERRFVKVLHLLRRKHKDGQRMMCLRVHYSQLLFVENNFGQQRKVLIESSVIKIN